MFARSRRDDNGGVSDGYMKLWIASMEKKLTEKDAIIAEKEAEIVALKSQLQTTTSSDLLDEIDQINTSDEDIARTARHHADLSSRCIRELTKRDYYVRVEDTDGNINLRIEKYIKL